MPSAKTLLQTFGFVGAASALANLTTTGCADASGLQTCLNTAAATAQTCTSSADANHSELELEACGCELYIDNFNCYATHCWNRVYECEYQQYITEYLRLCLVAKLPVPYFPAPEGAPDSCSCNLGNIYEAFNSSVTQGGTCINTDGDNLEKLEGCQCCELSGAISSIYSICPQTDPSLIGLSTFTDLETLMNLQFGDCNPYLSQFNCVKDLGFSSIAASGSYYASTNLPPSGTATLSNTGGSVTAPPSGSVFTYTQGGNSQVYTISAAGFNGAAPAAPTGTGPITTGTTGGATAGAPAPSTSSKSGARSLKATEGLWAGCVALAAYLLL